MLVKLCFSLYFISLDLDPDPRTQKNADPTGSGSTSLLYTAIITHFININYSLPRICRVLLSHFTYNKQMVTQKQVREVRSNLCHLRRLRHLIRKEPNTNRIYFLLKYLFPFMHLLSFHVILVPWYCPINFSHALPRSKNQYFFQASNLNFNVMTNPRFFQLHLPLFFFFFLLPSSSFYSC